MPARQVYVDLIEEKPQSLEAFTLRHGGIGEDAVAARYKRYLDDFQPFRTIITAGGNHRPLFRSTERYFNFRDALHAAELAFGPDTEVILRRTGQEDAPLQSVAND